MPERAREGNKLGGKCGGERGWGLGVGGWGKIELPLRLKRIIATRHVN
jgi:hypothetical protein